MIKGENCDNLRPLNQNFTNISSLPKNNATICLILHQFNLYVLPICGGKNWRRLKSSFLTFSGVKMCDKMGVSAYVVENCRKRAHFKASNESQGRLLVQSATNHWSIFLVKLCIKGLNYHNFHIFDHN